MEYCSECDAAVEPGTRSCGECGNVLENGGSTSAEGFETENGGSSDLPSTIWHKVIMVATGGWIVLMLGFEALPDVAVLVLFSFSLVLLPIGLYMDSRIVRQYGEWPKYRWGYVVLSILGFFGIIAGLVYLLKRRNVSVTGPADASEETSLREERSP